MKFKSCIFVVKINMRLFMPRILFTLILSFSFIGLLSAQGSRDNITGGFGWGMIYAENAGIYKYMEFKLEPTFSLSYSKELSERFDLRATAGAQMLNSGEFRPLNNPIIIQWGDNGQAYYFKGVGYFLDVMPVYYFNPNTSGGVGEPVNFYFGLGLGAMYSERAQRVMRDGVLENGMYVQGFVERSTQNTVAAYVPLKFGFISNFEYEWDLGLEVSSMFLTNSNVDGNNMQNKLIYPDVMVNFQFIVRRYINR
ncbi:hypothetical protein [Aquiflexum gelatinilyticum]|uniref:Uncharacterized protein n=1 Tax=Aquiflexum gelatinilyticum TaxID=2961943 RepID=A0A9X2P3R2_9BACT|nr:hypothetical protein [Aquiflexum gelatinilyticum]MCR9014101.1 hypothetical protein [Aquiflexum gelatinilyticum]